MTRQNNSTSWRKANNIASRPWTGSVREYDLVKELTIGVVVVGLLVLGVSAIFGSPDEPSVSLKGWAIAAPADFVATAAKELGSTSDTAGYGPPYNATPDAAQKIGPIDLQSLSGVRIRVDTANDFVIAPLETLPSPPAAVADWTAATDQQRSDWTAAYSDALDAAPDNAPASVAAGDYGPVPALTGALLDMARNGNLDGVLEGGGNFYNMDYTRSLLFLGDGTYFPDLAASQHLTGDQWGVMNETGDTPGQSWLWLFSLLYQVEPFKSSPNADALVVVTMLVLTALLAALPFIPGLRSLPRQVPVHRLIWRDYYRNR
ncbi:hypothetical protein QK292_09285 [Arthrobacter sp. AL08]|uniref:hypothetical protein n=1 Tax=Micrococcaceae TaxID=1268 RepID=UPI001CFF77B0|nr:MULTISPECIES: hypothetical protein [Micrococcaceae]MCB5281687.1 hypothetical protein [Arthrobacter sp. ES1]MDI3241911.1 hypothetical protein [Arthrobacter sp. AL05]MDI3277765.1 hypothetical protein [Arthrobacter sp. AL08]MDJ0351863.1 hypothetical protein [Pseudarthrobacter sp. PH31-O2]WGZ81016.1 hypothetical protein QI450_07580 [Arthrobacter sp. EM1]